MNKKWIMMLSIGFLLVLMIGTNQMYAATQYPVTFVSVQENVPQQMVESGGLITKPTGGNTVNIDGWYTDIERTKPWDFDKDKMGAAPLTLYGLDQQTVTFTMGGNNSINIDIGTSVYSPDEFIDPVTLEEIFNSGLTEINKYGNKAFGGVYSYYIDGKYMGRFNPTDNKMPHIAVKNMKIYRVIYEKTKFEGANKEIKPIPAYFLSIGNRILKPTPNNSENLNIAWYIDPERTKLYDFSETFLLPEETYGKYAKPATLYAKYMYPVKFEGALNQTIAPVEIPTGDLIPAPTLTDKTYKFVGWYKDSARTQKWDFATDKVGEAPVTLYARYAYPVNFEGAANQTIAPVEVPSGDLIKEPTLTDQRSKFVGWYKDVARTEENKWDFTKDKVGNAPITLYAKYACPVTYIIGDKVVKVVEVLTGDQTPLIAEDKLVLGWCKDPERQQEWHWQLDRVSNEPITLYGKIYHTIRYYPDPTNPESSYTRNLVTGELLRRGDMISGMDGWYRDSERTQKINFQTDKVFSDMSLYASYFCTFDMYNAVGQITFIKCSTGNLITEPTRSGGECEYLGWYDEKGEKWDFNTRKAVKGTVTLQEKYACPVNFEGAANQSIPQVTLRTGEMIPEPTLTDKNYKFLGWYDARDGKKWEFEKFIVTNRPITLYAKYACPVNFVGALNQTIAPVEVPTGNLIQEPTLTNKTYFKGWYKDSAKTEAWNFKTDKVGKEAITLYAKYAYPVKFLVSSDKTISSEDLETGSLVTEPVLTDITSELLGWYKNFERTEKWDFTKDKVGSAPITLYAKYNCTVKFVGDYTNLPQEKKYVTLSKIPAPQISDYFLMGWYTDLSGTQKWDFDKNLVTSEPITLYAKYKTGVTWYVEGTLVATSYEEPNKLISQVPTYSIPKGAVLEGWYTDFKLTNPFDLKKDLVPERSRGSCYILTAKVKKPLTFNTSGETVKEKLGSMWVYRGIAAELPKPESSGENVTFENWYSDAEYNYVVDPEIIEGTTVYAKWIRTAQFYDHLGQLIRTETFDTRTKDVSDIESLIDPSSRDGYQYWGFSKNLSSFDGYMAPTSQFSNGKYYPVWTQDVETVVNDGQSFDVVLSQPQPSLDAALLTLTDLSYGKSVSLQVQDSTDGGKTYRVKAELLGGRSYKLSYDKLGTMFRKDFRAPTGINPPTGITVRPPTTTANNNGSILGTTSLMEISQDENEWIGVAGSAVNNLTPGAYYIRFAKGYNDVASPSVKVFIPTYVEVQVKNVELDGFDVQVSSPIGPSLLTERKLVDVGSGTEVPFTITPLNATSYHVQATLAFNTPYTINLASEAYVFAGNKDINIKAVTPSVSNVSKTGLTLNLSLPVNGLTPSSFIVMDTTLKQPIAITTATTNNSGRTYILEAPFVEGHSYSMEVKCNERFTNDCNFRVMAKVQTTLSNATTTSAKLTLSRPVVGMTANMLTLKNITTGKFVVVSKVTTADQGNTYLIEAPLAFGSKYELTIANKDFYMFDKSTVQMLTVLNGSIVGAPTGTGFVLKLTPAVPGLTLSNFKLMDGAGKEVGLTSATTADKGANYKLAASLLGNTKYTLTVTCEGYTSVENLMVTVPLLPQAAPTGLYGWLVPSTKAQITGTTPAMEYKLEDAKDSTYVSATGPLSENLKIKEWYVVRYKATENSLASPTTRVGTPNSYKETTKTIAKVTNTGFEINIKGLPAALTVENLAIIESDTYARINISGVTKVNATTYNVKATLEPGKSYKLNVLAKWVQYGAPLGFSMEIQPQEAPKNLSVLAPTSTENTDGIIKGTLAGMEYQLGTNGNWTSVEQDGNIGNLIPGTYKVRYAAKSGFNASPEITVVIPKYVKKETCSIDEFGEQMTLSLSSAVPNIKLSDLELYTDNKAAKVKIDSVTAQNDDLEYVIVAKLQPNTQYNLVITNQVGYVFDNSPITMDVKKLGQVAPTSLAGEAPTTDTSDDGKITGVTNAMEYKKEGDLDYVRVIGTNIADLASGIYSVRYAETDNFKASKDVQITVPKSDVSGEATFKIIKEAAKEKHPNLRVEEKGTGAQAIRGLNPKEEKWVEVKKYFEVKQGEIKVYKWVNNGYIEINQSKDITSVIATKLRIDLYNNKLEKVKVCHVVIKGDVNGDGKINSVDFAMLQNSKAKVINSKGQSSVITDELFVDAGDINSDGKITAADVTMLKEHVFGTKLIIQ